MTSNWFKLTALLTLPLLIACEDNTTREWRVLNESSTPIQIELQSGFSELEDSSVGPDSVRRIIVTDQLGLSEFAGNPNHSFDSLLIYNTTDTVIKSVYDSDNWVLESEQVKTVPSDRLQRFTFVITDSDF